MDHQENVNHGAGQSVNVVVSDGSVRWIAAAIIVVAILLAFSSTTANRADLKANQAIKAAEDSATEFRQAQFWMQRSTVACQNAGVDMPPIPASFK